MSRKCYLMMIMILIHNIIIKPHKLKHFKYHSISEFNSAVSDYSSLCHCNIRSATKNGNNLSNHLNYLTLQFYIIALTETFLNENNTEIVLFSIYNHIFKYR